MPFLRKIKVFPRIYGYSKQKFPGHHCKDLAEFAAIKNVFT
jgi:hypothetical protein